MFSFRALQLDDGGAYCLDLSKGFRIPPQVRGKDWVVYGRHGQTPGNRKYHFLELPVEGYIRGIGTTAAERRESFDAATEAVMAVMDMSLDPGEVVLSGGYLGLPAGEEATILARCSSVAAGRVQSYNLYPLQLWSFELLSVVPTWDIGS